jgi:hypothetical protein
MNPRFFFLGGLALLAFTTGAFAQNGPVTIVNLNNTQPAPETPAPPQTNAPSAPGAQGPSGSNGINTAGKPMTKAPNTPPETKPNPNAAPPPPATPSKVAANSPVAKAAGSILDKYISDLTDAVKLSDDEKKEVQAYYQADGTTLQKVLNDPTLSPLQQAQQVADLRDQRDAKVDALLQDPLRQHEFYEVEANYRVALTLFAADGGLIPAPAASAAPPPAAVSPAPAPAAAK